MDPKPLVSIVDDDAATRLLVEHVVNSGGLRSRVFVSVEDFKHRGEPSSPGCIVVGFRMPGGTGLDLLDHLNRNGFHVPVIFLTDFADVRTAVQAIKAGAADFLIKPFVNEDLLAVVHAAIDLDRRTRRGQLHIQTLKDRYEGLTLRQREVMNLLVRGRLTKQIAADLDISSITVKFHRRQLMRRMGASSLADLVRMFCVMSESGQPTPDL